MSWWKAVSRRLAGKGEKPVESSAMRGADDFRRLLAPLPPFAHDEFLRRTRFAEKPPRTADDLLELVQGWASSAGIAEGRGGYPGGTAAPGWAEYVHDQQRNVAVYRAVVGAFGELRGGRAKTLGCYEKTFGPDVRHLGKDHEGHVDEMAGRLVYSLPSKAAFDRATFSCGIAQEDLDVLRAGPYRRAVLEGAARERLERSALPYGRPVTEMDFADLVFRALHSTPTELRHFVEAFGRQHGVDLDASARKAMAEQAAG
ncbi:MAG: hypothetical protein EON57_00630 [Alphaproteobacteria bacterium]|nr:MAG: hypothetical protein EON57_00630 [Alphaproteobacteria bacterium]